VVFQPNVIARGHSASHIDAAAQHVAAACAAAQLPFEVSTPVCRNLWCTMGSYADQDGVSAHALLLHAPHKCAPEAGIADHQKFVCRRSRASYCGAAVEWTGASSSVWRGNGYPACPPPHHCSAGNRQSLVLLQTTLCTAPLTLPTRCPAANHFVHSMLHVSNPLSCSKSLCAQPLCTSPTPCPAANHFVHSISAHLQPLVLLQTAMCTAPLHISNTSTLAHLKYQHCLLTSCSDTQQGIAALLGALGRHQADVMTEGLVLPAHFSAALKLSKLTLESIDW